MARCYCRWRRVLICVCSPCICLILLFLYAGIMVCMDMNTKAQQMSSTIRSLENEHFVAWGSFKNKSFAPLPKTFWKLDEEAFWNRLQVTVDRHFNPILKPPKIEMGIRNNAFYDSLLRLSFSEVIDLENMRKKIEQLPRQMQDFVGHMKQRNYPVIIQPADSTCGAGAADEKEPPLLLLAIKSTELNLQNRQAIRQTWGQVGWVGTHRKNSHRRQEVGGYIRRVFLIGKENPQGSGMDASELLQMEGQYYGDIVQWDFSDTFFNLSLKDVHFWSWFSSRCSQTRFVFKGDDDVFVNLPNMIAYLHEQLEKPHAEQTMNEFMVGDVIGAAFPNRLCQSKYFVPDSFYKGLYPTYAGGGGVVYSGQLAKRLHDVSRRVHLFPIDDVFVGMCMARLNASPIHHPAFLTFDFPKMEEAEPCAYHTILLVHKRSPTQLIELWDNVSRTRNQCWNVPLRVSDQKVNASKV
ncbi:N-acetyllactosaminide beta-1,3-N-acetylglucosaminyltransferase 2-like [Dunckerocampus dactyliophorus]|uniref:N-acetyllactosaminide beta-1,3-N-acetylglucosaminyltransferase 2-like n=1 Tax=Dunckerocampus dactyliophorus TaxID=161453 RepID=UPI002406767D|nr:N-acetyllactosaminide beta-1,3-N-acetylglucosaminyltransferase 2-like [Dunckerocampus dactyliophorus]